MHKLYSFALYLLCNSTVRMHYGMFLLSYLPLTVNGATVDISASETCLSFLQLKLGISIISINHLSSIKMTTLVYRIMCLKNVVKQKVSMRKLCGSETEKENIIKLNNKI